VLVLHLLCRCIVLRAILKPTWLDENGRITSTAFIHDPIKHPDGLSVNIAVETNLHQWLTSFNKSFGADGLHCGWMRNLALEIGQAEGDILDGAAHAVIVGLPSPDEDPQRAEDLATELVKISRAVDRTIRKKVLST
jgi:hypothetical protein